MYPSGRCCMRTVPSSAFRAAVAVATDLYPLHRADFKESRADTLQDRAQPGHARDRALIDFSRAGLTKLETRTIRCRV